MKYDLAAIVYGLITYKLPATITLSPNGFYYRVSVGQENVGWLERSQVEVLMARLDLPEWSLPLDPKQTYTYNPGVTNE